MRRLVWLCLVGIACGRTEVVGFTLPPPVTVDAGPDAGSRDAGVDAGVDAGFDAGPIDAGFVPRPCIDGTFSLSPAEPVVMMVLDRSGSMDTLISRTETRWEALVASLQATLPQVDQTMQLGGLAFPSNTGDLCVVPPVAGIWPARGNVSLLVANLRSLRPEGLTPTESALGVASQVLRGRRAGNSARAMVLATDGEPNCSSNPLSGTLNELSRAAADGIPTYVIGIADDASLRAPLQAMSLAGSRPRTGSQGFYSAQSPAELQLAFRTIRDQVGACSFLTSSVPDTDGGIRVTFEGAEVPTEDGGMGGWRWTDRENGELALTGPVCARAVARPSSLVVTVSCSARAP
ncbi:MAG: vWA domain-containing protein [Myxococcales bacterium]|nr:vWA domain-containing protein [Myxococcales bacterium]MDP3504927.1 vWA domain-containing protein [Myxococcales bacterium]